MEAPLSESAPIKDQAAHRDEQQVVSKVLMEMITEHISDSVFIMKVTENTEFIYMFANNAALDSINQKRENIIGKSIDSIVKGPHGDKIRQSYKQAYESKKTVRYIDEVFINSKLCFYETLLTPIFENGQDKKKYIAAITRDITAQQNEKNELKKMKHYYSSLISHNLDSIFILSINGEILNVNKAASELFQTDRANGLMPKIEDYFDPEFFLDIYETMKMIRQGRSLSIPSINMRKTNGAAIIADIKFIPIKIEEKVEGMYLIARDITSEKQKVEQIHFLSRHDHLTGLLNRRALEDQLNQIIKKHDEDSSFAVISLDLDRFKILNDFLGYNNGDDLLKEVAARLASYTSLSVQLYRLTADEFVFIANGLDRHETESFVEQVAADFSRPFTIEGEDYYLSTCFGIYMIQHSENLTADSVISCSRQALTAAKAKGNAQFLFYRDGLKDSFPNELLMETHLRRAIELNELTLFYQPQVNLTDGRIHSVEALLRWNNGKFGSVAPSQFIPLAETTGLILPIGKWVIDQACLQLELWNRKGLEKTRIAINISPQQFSQEDFDESIKQALERHQLEPSMLEIEITESAMGNVLETLNMLKKLKKIGIKISIDDFGTGYSSLNYLKNFPIDILKIDQSFVKELQTDVRDAAITKTIIHLAHSLGMEVVAEGVEEPYQVDFLKNEKCQKGQGYFFSKPVSSKEIEKHLIAIG
ncbi:EAL domain-containing protein [Jeotgalibacillus proteolyticus]|uniref:EAL domain-containing protein n=1 Tax=Jeotgalibacillus proteolyticus TaxID=2082395 RepID=UPI003CF4AD97